MVDQLVLEMTPIIRLCAELTIEHHGRVRMLCPPEDVETAGGDSRNSDVGGRERGAAKQKRDRPCC